jgi:hypothetical protein
MLWRSESDNSVARNDIEAQGATRLPCVTKQLIIYLFYGYHI